MKIDHSLTPARLAGRIERMFELSGRKIVAIEKHWKASKGAPVFTVQGVYTSRGWTEWTQGFQFGAALLQFDATGERDFLELGRSKTLSLMAPHLTHLGVHDHGFNNVSTYGYLRRLMAEGKIEFNTVEQNLYNLALKVSGAVQASRWTATANGRGFIYSFNGPHSLFIDTMRSLRSLAIGHHLGHVLMGEKDQRISLLKRLVDHALTTAEFAIYYGEARDSYDARGRVAHESVFNTNDGNYRCPNSQQGYSPFSTWTRGLAWALCGYAEQLEFLETCDRDELRALGGAAEIERACRQAAQATADFYLENSCACGVPMWDTGAPNLHRLGDYLKTPADPFNPYEPVDSSAAAIAAQGFWRLGNYLQARKEAKLSRTYQQAALTILDTLLAEPYLSSEPDHQGLLLHSVYHRPNGWDYIPRGQKVPNGESSMWGDYHLREAALLIYRQARGEKYFHFFD